MKTIGTDKLCPICELYKFESEFEICSCGEEICLTCLFNSEEHLKHLIKLVCDKTLEKRKGEQ